MYQSELSRIFILWLVKIYKLEVTTQWHVVYESASGSKLQHRFCDIIIKPCNNSQQPMILLELLASGTEDELNEHFDRMLRYATNFDNSEVWVVNFTCLDSATSEPLWQSDQQLNQGLNVIHVWHNLSFTEMCVAFRSHEDGSKNMPVKLVD